ncbi:MAG: T9SS type A sorting domain-containing protein [Ignavibacteria bacterium]|nr:MAG: T9SS type A sorting domain-containing protein [Ignavibacteria bacterium]
MKNLAIIVFSFFFQSILLAQVKYTDQLIENSVYGNAPETLQQSKPFVRERWFFEQRAYPEGIIPENAYGNAIRQRDELRQQNINLLLSFNWVSLGPTPGTYFNYGNISSRIVTGAFDPSNPDIIYVGPANGGVWKSTDGGVNWEPLTDNELSLAMGSIAIDPTNTNIIYAGTGEATYSGASYYGRGLLKSTNAGNSWVNITSGLPYSTYFSRLKIRPHHPQELIAALGSRGLYRSTNSGVNWTQLVAGRTDDIIFSPTGDTAFAVGSGIGLRRSTDGGVTFQSFGSGLISGSRTHFDLCLSSPNTMYAAVYGSNVVRLFKSNNYGENWSELPTTSNFRNLDHQAWYDLYCIVNPQNPKVAYVGTIDVFRTTDGINFSNITNGYAGGSVHVDQHYLFFHPTDENTFFACNDGGIWKTTDNGDSFTNLNQGLTLTQFYRIAASPFNPSRILGGTQDNGTQQTFSSLNWAAAYGGDGGEVAFNPFDPNYIIGETQNGGLFRTSNGGSSWSSAMGGINTSENVAWVAPIITHPNTSGTFYVARQRVYRSTNNGGLWMAISGNVNGNSSVREMAISNSNPAIMYATSSSNVFHSIDGGITWVNKTNGLPNKTITSVHIHPRREEIALITFSGFGTSKVFKTTDMGNSWKDIHGDLPDSPVNDVFIYDEDDVHPNTYFAATDIGIFITQDNGIKWVELSDGLPNTVIMDFDYSPTTKMLRAGTHGRGVYEAFIDLTIPVELESFTAVKDLNKVILNWETATETNNFGFEIERKLKNQDWITLGFVNGKGTTTEIQSYQFIDDYSFLAYEGKILYRLKQIDYDGTYDYSKQVYVDVAFIPEEFYVSQNYPNPFNPVTTIEYSLPSESNVRLSIYNSVGQEIAKLVSSLQQQGTYKIVWDASRFASGIYFYSFEVEELNGQKSVREMKKIVLMK